MKLPRYHEVGIDSATGLVFRYASINHPYEDPGSPKVDKTDAEAAAREASGMSNVTSDQLIVVFADTGTQQLVYDIALEGPADASDAAGVVRMAEVHVDAMTGATIVVAVG